MAKLSKKMKRKAAKIIETKSKSFKPKRTWQIKPGDLVSFFNGEEKKIGMVKSIGKHGLCKVIVKGKTLSIRAIRLNIIQSI